MARPVFVLLLTLCATHTAVGLDVCIHDLLPRSANSKPSTASPSGSDPPHGPTLTKTRTSRAVVGRGQVEPLRVHYEFHDVASELSIAEQQQLDSIVGEAVQQVRDILKVSPVVGPLLLQRAESSCLSRWTSGPNEGRCGRLSGGYNGETCLDGFRLPEDHLDGLYVWNATHPEPWIVRPPGQGVADADYVLYVRASTTAYCLQRGQTVMAYATYCQQNELGRPVAGLINYCPVRLRAAANDRKKIILTSIHELFHALGFSKDLWDEYRDCSQRDSLGNCPTYRHPTRFVFNRTRLITPHVMGLAQSYFDCSLNLGGEFGPALEETESGDAGSHWDDVMMRGSIMTAELGEVSVTRLDPFTLAALADSGWYDVNLNASQDLVWGRGGGCEFGLPASCHEQSSFFCSQGCLGCHTLHRHKGICEPLDGQTSCAVVMATEQGACENPANEANSMSSWERFGASSRCFLSNLSSEAEPGDRTHVGGCLLHRCHHTELQVQVGDTWCSCPYGSHIQVTEVSGMLGVLQCPAEGILCTQSEVVSTDGPSSIIPVSTGATANGTSVPHEATTPSADMMRDLTVELVFLELSCPELMNCDQLDSFAEQVKATILVLGRLLPGQLCDISVCDGSVPVTFTLHAYTQSDVDIMSAYERLQNSVQAGNFIIHLPGNRTYVASFIKIVGDEDPVGSVCRNWCLALEILLSLGLLLGVYGL